MRNRMAPFSTTLSEFKVMNSVIPVIAKGYFPYGCHIVQRLTISTDLKRRDPSRIEALFVSNNYSDMLLQVSSVKISYATNRGAHRIFSRGGP